MAGISLSTAATQPQARSRLLEWGVLCLGLGIAGGALAQGDLGFGLSKKYCLGETCLGDAADEHPVLNLKAIFTDLKPIPLPVCYSSTFSAPLHDFGNGSLGEFIIQNDPARSAAGLTKYYRIQSIRIRFHPPLTADSANRIEQDIVGRYGMKKSSYRTFYLQDGKRRINFTDNGSANFNLSVTGIERTEYQAQPGCIRKVPSL